jgi:uncharacterized protein (TIGR02246 family)
MTKLVSSLTMAGVAMLAIAVSGCGTKTAAPADSASIEATIKADEKNWMDQFKNRDLEALAGHYADDAVFVSSAGPAANGSTEIRRFFANGLTDKNFTVTFASDKIDVAASGDLAYSRGHFTEQFTDPKTAKIMTQDGSYLEVFKKQDDGNWKMVADFAVGDPTTLKEVPPGKPATRAKMVSFG